MAARCVILYDESCPLCALYTRGLAALGAAEREGLGGAAQTCPSIFARLDVDRARHFIPLIDRESGQVFYGLDALCTSLAGRFPALAPLFHSRLPKALYPLYWLITYNRRVIAGCRPSASGFDCAPDVRLAPRLTYLALALLGTLALSAPLGLAALLGLSLLLALGRGLDALGSAATWFLTLALLFALGGPLLAALILLPDLRRRAWVLS